MVTVAQWQSAGLWIQRRGFESRPLPSRGAGVRWLTRRTFDPRHGVQLPGALQQQYAICQFANTVPWLSPDDSARLENETPDEPGSAGSNPAGTA